jgi:hypothetical protein
MFGILGLALSFGASALGYIQTRSFVSKRLRFVEAVQRGGVPLLAGAAAFVVALPVVGILPIIGGGTALLFGAGVGFGVAHGRDEIRHRVGSGR